MNTIPFDQETDPIRRTIIAAANRLLTGTPQRSDGRLNATQLAVEANLKRWHLTHQHPDLKDLFLARAAELEAERAGQIRAADAFTELKTKHTDLQKRCAFLETRLQTYATALNLLSLEDATLTGSAEQQTKLRHLPRRAEHMP